MKYLCRYLILLTMIFSVERATGQIIIADTQYDSSQWATMVITEFGGSEVHEQRLDGGNPDAYRYMRHTLPEPPGLNDLTSIEVVHIYMEESTFPLIDTVVSLDYSEDIRLLNLPWPDAFVISGPALLQNGMYYRCTQFISVVGDTSWTSGGLTGLTESDFVAIDGSGTHPDFTIPDDLDDKIYFGYWRLHTRGFTQPPVPPNEDLVYEHGSDNWSVTLYEEEPGNARPVANADQFLYLDYFQNTSGSYNLLANDFDANGDSIWISDVGDGSGEIIEVTATSIEYRYTGPVFPTKDFFTYEISDGQDTSSPAPVTIYFCQCPIGCFDAFLPPPGGSPKVSGSGIQRSGLDSLDVELFRRLRDDFLSPDTTGLEMIDFYYYAAQEVIPLLLVERQELGMQAFRALNLMQPPLQSLLDGDGSAQITQNLVDSVSIFLDSLLVAVSDSLRDSLSLRLEKLCPLQDLVGLTVAEAAAQVFCDSMSTSTYGAGLSRRNIGLAPNPFSEVLDIQIQVETAIDLRIHIVDLTGNPVTTFPVDHISPGQQIHLQWTGVDQNGRPVPDGLYLVQFQTPTGLVSDKVLLMRR